MMSKDIRTATEVSRNALKRAQKRDSLPVLSTGADVWKISRPRDISSDLEAISRPRDISRSPAISSNLKQSRSTETQLQNQGNSLLWRQAQFTYRQKAAITESLAHGELLF